ncbi:hypothetical protein ACFWUZ_34325, partial [Streptomyces sp. NPDC058646]|uniref:hypothetical protein n=1 Tax=Streptomyces sp. NPDC058646 TaxID=3346574 RepID=UPI00364A3DBD
VFTPRSPATDLIVAPGLDRYNATASALNSAGQCFIPTGTPFSWTIKIQVSPVSKIRGQGPSDQLVAPAADGGLGHVVAAGHVGQALVVAQYGQDDDRDPSRRQDPPPGSNRLQMASQ